MRSSARAALLFAIGFWAALVLFGAVEIYGFDSYEGEWGREVSLLFHICVATLGALTVLVPTALGFRVGAQTGAVPRGALSFVSGAVVALGFLLVGLVFPAQMIGGVILIVATVLASFCAAYLLCMTGKRTVPSPSNQRLERL